ncbi:MAG: cytochrome c oxidase subunit II [Candidatus Methylomirabilales bacterium]
MFRWLPEMVSTYGGEIDSIMYLIYAITGVWFFLTYGAMALFLILYRRREGHRATYIEGNRLREAAWILIPGLIVLLLDLWIDFRGGEVWAKVKGHVPPSDLLVQVTGKQFNWEILYPGPDGQFGTGDDLQLDNELHVPVNKVVRVILKSKDVIHSFFLPHLRLKQDAVPGRAIEAWFEATKPGRYELPCAELCGFGHSGMKGFLIVHPPDEYEKWVREQWSSS